MKELGNFLLFMLLAGIVWLSWIWPKTGVSPEADLVLYPAICSESESLEDCSESEIVVYPALEFRLHPDLREAHFRLGRYEGRLAQCLVIDSKNWSCSTLGSDRQFRVRNGEWVSEPNMRIGFLTELDWKIRRLTRKPTGAGFLVGYWLGSQPVSGDWVKDERLDITGSNLERASQQGAAE